MVYRYKWQDYVTKIADNEDPSSDRSILQYDFYILSANAALAGFSTIGVKKITLKPTCNKTVRYFKWNISWITICTHRTVRA